MEDKYHLQIVNPFGLDLNFEKTGFNNFNCVKDKVLVLEDIILDTFSQADNTHYIFLTFYIGILKVVQSHYFYFLFDCTLFLV